MPDFDDLPGNQIVLHFETNNVIELTQLSAVFSEFSRLAHADPSIGPDAIVVLLRLKSGSPTTAWIEILNACGAVAGIGQFGLGVAALVQQNRQKKFCRRLGEMMLDNDVMALDIAVREGIGGGVRRMTMARSEIPAVAAIEAMRNWPNQQLKDDEIEGRIVTTHGGRFALFRTHDVDYQIVGPGNLLEQIPIGEDLIITADKDGNSIEITDWRLASDDDIDWENDAALPGIQAEKLRAIEARSEWPDSFDEAPDETRMRGIMYTPGDDFISLENTRTFIGRFAYEDGNRIFRTEAGHGFRIAKPDKYETDRDFVVRAQILPDDAGRRDWLRITDVFPITD